MAPPKSKPKPKPAQLHGQTSATADDAGLRGDLERALYALAILQKRANTRPNLTPADVSRAIAQARVDPERLAELSAGI